MCLMSVALHAQKQPLTHDVYDDWKSLESIRLSNDGNWAAYRITPQVGDATLELRNLETDELITVDRVSKYAFSANSMFVAAKIKPAYQDTRALKLKKTAKNKMPKDSLYIIDLTSAEMTKVARVKNYQMPEDSDRVDCLAS